MFRPRFTLSSAFQCKNLAGWISMGVTRESSMDWNHFVSVSTCVFLEGRLRCLAWSFCLPSLPPSTGGVLEKAALKTGLKTAGLLALAGKKWLEVKKLKKLPSGPSGQSQPLPLPLLPRRRAQAARVVRHRHQHQHQHRHQVVGSTGWTGPAVPVENAQQNMSSHYSWTRRMQNPKRKWVQLMNAWTIEKYI